jgi:AcrR family transcriptional regulator
MSPEAVVTDAARPLRADALRNRELILRTAAEVFAAQGLDAGYDEIARRAGIGVGTVYRRFPERSELVQALFESRIAEIIAIAEEATAMSDAFEGLAWFLERALERQVVDRGLKEAMTRAIDRQTKQAIGRECLAPVLERLIARAQADGSLRNDVAATDLGMQLMAISSMTTPSQPELWRRYLALFLDGLRARPDLRPLPQSAPIEDATYDMMCNLQGRRND